MKEPKPIALGAQLVSLEVALVSLLQVIGRTQPAAAHLVVAAMRDTASLIPEKHFPGVSEKVEQYVEAIEAEIGASDALIPDNTSSRRGPKTVLQ